MNRFFLHLGDPLPRPSTRREKDLETGGEHDRSRPSPALIIGGVIVAGIILIAVLVVLFNNNSVSSVVVGNIEKEIDGISFPIYTSVNGVGEYDGKVDVEIYYEDAEKPIYSGNANIRGDTGRHKVEYRDFLWGNGEYHITVRADGQSDVYTMRMDSVADKIVTDWNGFNADSTRLTPDYKVEVTMEYLFGNRTSPNGEDPQSYTFKGEIITPNGERFDINSTGYPANILTISRAIDHTEKGTYALSGSVTNNYCHPNSPFREVTVSEGIFFSFDAPPMASAGDDITKNLTEGEAVVEFDASDSWDDSGIVEYIWYVGDLSIETTSSPTLTYTFTDIGIYYVSLEVVDDGGNSSQENAELSTVIVEIE